MNPIRRRVLRSVPVETATDPSASARLVRVRTRLAKEKSSLKRWMTRLKRATNTVTALHQSITRLEATING
jgi:hypothetical protein